MAEESIASRSAHAKSSNDDETGTCNHRQPPLRPATADATGVLRNTNGDIVIAKPHFWGGPPLSAHPYTHEPLWPQVTGMTSTSAQALPKEGSW